MCLFNVLSLYTWFHTGLSHDCSQARPDLKMEFFHLMSFLLSHCNSKWKVANDQVNVYATVFEHEKHGSRTAGLLLCL